MKTQKEIRKSFWESHPEYKRKGRQSQNDYPADIRMAFCDHVDSLARNSEITESLAGRVTL